MPRGRKGVVKESEEDNVGREREYVSEGLWKVVKESGVQDYRMCVRERKVIK